ncbi:MAG TPA: hypothetical protein VNU01_04515 [Egibacteraceae bacterium]|nr:hypothetical protein [Egibacteraceae bacterium]
MPDMLIRNVPEAVQDVLKRRAKEAGMSVQRYVVKLLEEHTERMTMREWLDMVGQRPKVPGLDAAQAVREAREEDDRLWDEHLRDRYPEAFK